ncbi:transposase, partial [Escherichia coli]|uniref:transposase n=1 Tax=Escherichia coli TaxID=562 RepID=UPI0035C88221
LTDFRGKTSIFSHPVYLFLREFSLQDSRGGSENTNGLIRQYFPKKTCLAQYTQHELDLVAAQLNNRPRKTLKFKTPKEIIERGVALTD